VRDFFLRKKVDRMEWMYSISDEMFVFEIEQIYMLLENDVENCRELNKLL